MPKPVRTARPAARSRRTVTAREKLGREHASHGKLEPITPKLAKWLGRNEPGGTMLIPRPLDVDATLRKVRKGRVLTVFQLRASLAKEAGADAACPLCTGIFARLAAEAAEEDRAAGKSRVTPYWRLVKDDGSLNPRFPGGIEAQSAKLRAEGIEMATGRRGGTPKVVLRG